MTSRRELANAIRVLSMDAVQKAHSGHPGMPMGMADIAEVLWNDFLRHNPLNPHWPNRDRFVLSNGHGSMLLYALLHLTGYDLKLDELKQFRQLHSKTPGHPELGETKGVETTTGPLGQGLANAVGFAIAEKHLASEFNRENYPIIDHYTYVFMGDGCLMEGISHEVCSLAGTLGLGKLIAFYDDNNISIDGETAGWFTDNTPERFKSYGWHVIPGIDGHNSSAIREAILEAHSVTDKPTLICCKTILGWGSPNAAGKAKAHGEALGDVEVDLVRKNLNWPWPPFVIPDAYYEGWDARKKGIELEEKWQNLFLRYQAAYPELAQEWLRRSEKKLPENWSFEIDKLLQELQNKKENMATRKASQLCLNHLGRLLPELMGGSADLTGSNLTQWKEATVFSSRNPQGQYIHYGVREFGMSAIMNGLAVYGSIIPFGGTFLTFSDYARNALRLAAMMRQRVIFVYTHDSIGLGEDGPTHQPIEHLPSLRLIPGLSLWRPCDSIETTIAWQCAIEHTGPTCLLFSRQTLPFIPRHSEQIKNISRGGYILSDCEGVPEVILMATGSEVELAIEAAHDLADEGIAVRVVSMPSTDVFLKQSAAYQSKVLPASVTARLAIEAAATDFWYKLIGCHGRVIGIETFGASAPAKEVFQEYGFTKAHILSSVKEMLKEQKNILRSTTLV